MQLVCVCLCMHMCMCGTTTLETSRYCTIKLFQCWDLSSELSPNILDHSLTSWAEAVGTTLALEQMSNISLFACTGLDCFKPPQIRILTESHQKLMLIRCRILNLLDPERSTEYRPTGPLWKQDLSGISIDAWKQFYFPFCCRRMLPSQNRAPGMQ